MNKKRQKCWDSYFSLLSSVGRRFSVWIWCLVYSRATSWAKTFRTKWPQHSFGSVWITCPLIQFESPFIYFLFFFRVYLKYHKSGQSFSLWFFSNNSINWNDFNFKKQIIYTIFNRNFRRAFKRIVLCQICANDSIPNSRRFSRTASQTRDNTNTTHHKRSSASPAHQTSSKFCDINTSLDNNRETESNNHQNQSLCHNVTYKYDKPLSWKFNTTFNAHNNSSKGTQIQNKECSL